MNIILKTATLFAVCVATAIPAAAGSVYRVIEGCHYPNGWNITDFNRDLNGIPNGRDHQCLDTYRDGRLIARRKADLY